MKSYSRSEYFQLILCLLNSDFQSLHFLHIFLFCFVSGKS